MDVSFWKHPRRSSWRTSCWSTGSRGVSSLAPGAFFSHPSVCRAVPHTVFPHSSHFPSIFPFSYLRFPNAPSVGLSCASQPEPALNRPEAAPACSHRLLNPWASHTATNKARLTNNISYIWTNAGLWAQTGSFQPFNMKDAYSSASCGPEDSKGTKKIWQQPLCPQYQQRRILLLVSRHSPANFRCLLQHPPSLP